MAARRVYPLLFALVLVSVAFCALASAAQFGEVVPGLPPAVGAAWGDYDDDGYPDLFMAGGTLGSSVSTPHGPLLYHNNRDLTFSDVSASFGFPSVPFPQDGPGWADCNNDGALDLLVASASRFPFLYKRDGTQFVEVGDQAGFNQGGPSRHVAWCDYDGDNLLDVFLPINGQDSYLYHNNGDGTFADVHVQAGIFTSPYPASGIGGQSAAWGDYNNDGRPDLLISRIRGGTMLYHNDGDGTFTDVSAQSGVDVAADCLSAIWGDYDNDGWLDLYLTAGPYLNGNGGRHWLFHSNYDGTFTDVGATAGLSSPVTVGGGAAWVDYDNDGYLDLYVTNWHFNPYLYHNNGNGTFTNVALGSGLETPFDYQGGAAVWGDMNLDGRMDLLQCAFGASAATDRSLLYRNIGAAGNWLRVRALTSRSGDATASGVPTRDAIGARVELNLDNDRTFPTGGQRMLTRLIGGDSGWEGQNEQVTQFGLGTAPVVAVRVSFPDGRVVIHQDVSANQQIVIRDVPADRTEIFNDVPLDYWSYAQVRAAVNAGIVKGYTTTSYEPALAVTRDQMAVYIARALAAGDGNVPSGPANATFPDDVPSDQWAYRYIEYAVAQGVVQGYDATHYQPALVVDRGQMAVFIARAKGWVKLTDSLNTAPQLFPDVPAAFWSGVAIKACLDHGVVKGYDDGTYQPGREVTRDQMAVYVARAFELPM